MNSQLPVDQSAEMERSDGAARKRDIVPTAVSENAIRLGRNCRERRMNLSMTQTELAKRSGVAGSHLSHIENARGNPTLEIMESIAAALRCTVPDLLSSANDPI